MYTVTTRGWLQHWKTSTEWEICELTFDNSSISSRPGDPAAYQKLQNRLIKCENIGHVQRRNVFDTPEIMHMMYQNYQSGQGKC